MRVMIEASQVTTGVTPAALAVQYAKLIGIVKMDVGATACAEPLGGVKLMVVVFRRFLAFRKMSCSTPPAAARVGEIPVNVTGLDVALMSTRVATANSVGSEADQT